MPSEPIMRGIRPQGSHDLPARIQPVKFTDRGTLGTEKIVRSVELRYVDAEKTIDGLVLVESRAGMPQDAEKQIDELEKQWRYIKEVNQRRKKNSQTTLRIPNTIRRYTDEHHSGLLMTDLSQNGQRWLRDLKAVSHHSISDHGWRVIRQKVLNDINLARQERIILGGGPGNLDPWVITQDRETDEYDVYVVDLGYSTHVNVTQEEADAAATKARKAFQDIEDQRYEMLHNR